MKEVKIQIADNCELIKDGNTYIVKEKKQEPPRSWEEFCEKYPLTEKEAFIDSYCSIKPPCVCCEREALTGRNWCPSKEEAEAFLALMQLRQLRKAWVGDWEQPVAIPIGVIHYWLPEDKVKCTVGGYCINRHLSFPTLEMAKEFFNCFKDLCETAKILL